MASYPSSVKSFSTKSNNDTIEASHVNDPQDEITAIENGLLNGLAHTVLFNPDNSFDIGASGATRPRDLFLGRDLAVGDDAAITGDVTVGGTLAVTSTIFPTGGFGISATSYTPTFSGLTVGDGTVNGVYFVFGKMVWFQAAFAMGSTSAVGAGLTVTLPAVAANSFNAAVGITGLAWDANAGAFFPVRAVQSTTSAVILTNNETTGLGALATAVPFAWANGDILSVSGVYQAA